VEDMTSKEEDLNGILSNPSGGYDLEGRGFDYISSNPSGGYDIQGSGCDDSPSNPIGGYDKKEEDLTIFRATLVEDMTSMEWDVSYMYGNLEAADCISDK
jgi:hypothetical protein